MNKAKLIKLVETIISLKAKLKCSICLDVMQDVAELDCGHQYCKDCYLEHKSVQKQAFCPQCKKIFKRRSSIYSDNYASSLGKFVQNCCDNIKEAYNCEVEQLQKRLREGADESKFTDNVSHQNVTNKNNSLAIPSTSRRSNQITKWRGRSEEKHNTKKTNKRRTEDGSVKKSHINAFDKLMNDQPAPTFNKKGTTRVYANKRKLEKKLKVQRDILEFNNYENKTAVLQWLQDTRNKFDRLSQTQNIGGDSCEIPVIDLVSISQIREPKKECKPVTSKCRKSRAKSLDIEVKRVLPSQKKVNSQIRSVSLENYNIDDNTEEEVVKKAEEKVIQDLIEDEFLEALDNQMKETNETQFDIKSKRYSKAKKKSKPVSPTSTTTGWERLSKINKTIKKNERVPKKLNITLQSTQEYKNEDSVPLDNKQTLNKTADTDVRTRELKIALTPRDFTKKAKNVLQKPYKDLKQNTSKAETVNVDSNKKQPTGTNLLQLDNEETITKATDADVSTKELKVTLTPRNFTREAKSITLQKPSKDVKQNIAKDEMENIDSNEPTTDKPSDTSKQEVELIQTVVSDENVVIENKSSPPEKHTEKHTEDNASETGNENCKQCYDLERLEDYLSKNIEIIDKNLSTDTSLLQTPQHEKTEADVHNSKDSDLPTDRSSQNREEQENTPFKDDSCVLLNVLFDMPTQKISHTDSSKSEKENEIIVIEDDPEMEPMDQLDQDSRTLEGNKRNASLDEITKLYSCPTQEINHTCTDKSDKPDKQGSMEGLLHLLEEGLEKCITNLKSADLTVENNLQNMLSHLSKLKTLHKKENEFNKPEPAVIERCNAETQIAIEVIDGTAQTECDINNVGVQTEDLYCIKCNADLNKDKAPEDLTLISQDTKAAMERMVDETDIDFKPTLYSTVANKTITPQLKPRSRNQEFTCTLDNLNFDTQEIAKNRGSITKIPQKITSQNPVATQNKVQTSLTATRNKTDENIPSSVLVCSLSSNKSTGAKKINRKLTYEADKRYKRIRRPTSDSDSEGEEEAPAKRKCNRFLRDDLTVEFLTNPEISDSKEDTKALASELPDSESFNYDEYLSAVMKKYEDGSFSSSSPQYLKKPKAPTPKQKLNKKCEEMINNSKKIASPLKTITELSCASSKDSFTTASNSVCNNFEDDEIFMNEDNLLKLESDIRKYEKKVHSSEISDIISETEHVEPSPKKRKTPMGDILSPKDFGLNNPDLEPCNVLNDTSLLRMADVVESRMDLDNEKKIKILANVKIKSQDNKQVVKGDDDDMFSDDDIVETTPQKKIDSFAKKLAHSRIMGSIDLIDNTLPPPKETDDNFDFDSVPLPPPPDFQDDFDIPPTPEHLIEEDNLTKDNITVIDVNKSSLTPDNLSQFIFRNPKAFSPCIKQIVKGRESEEKVSEIKNFSHNENLSLTPDNLTQQNVLVQQENLSHSTPFVQVDLTTQSSGLSPVTARKSQKMGMTEMTQAAKYTPLTTVTKQTPQKLNLFTSTPKQKSIWNYVRLSQPSDDAAQSEKLKPCIACTRLSKDQTKMVNQLMEKKLVTFSSHFNKHVTHMIVNPNENNCVKEYTIKLVSAVAAGIWVLSFQWVEECLKKNCIVAEEPFEVLDISGYPGPKTSRLTRIQNPLFKGYKFFCTEPFLSTTKGEVESIIKMVGGRLVEDMEDLLVKDDDIGFIVAEGHATQDFDQFERWVEMYKTVTVDIEWLSKCVGQYKILNIRPYLWCSEDNLEELGYPSVLTETVPISFTETF